MPYQMTVQVLIRDDGVPRLGVLAHDELSRLLIAVERPLRPPHSPAAVRRAVDAVLCSWLEPTLFDSPSEALHDIVSALTD
jgi:hypothetical protein